MPFASISPAAPRVAFARTSAPARCTFLLIAAALTLNPCSFELSAQQLSAATSRTVPKQCTVWFTILWVHVLRAHP